MNTVSRLIIASILCSSLLISAENTLVPGVFNDSILTLQKCFDLARVHNPTLSRAVDRLVEIRGEETVVKSRLLPHLSLVGKIGLLGEIDSLDENEKTQSTRERSLDIQLRQRIVEFGPTNEAEFDRVRKTRSITYEQEDLVSDILSQIRKAYFTLQIIRKQLERHETFLQRFSGQLEVLQNDASGADTVAQNLELSAQLNCLEERQRISVLKGQERRLFLELKNIMGLNHFSMPVVLATVYARFDVSEDSCVAAAMSINTELKDIEEEAKIFQKKLMESGWEFAPEVKFSMGLHKWGGSAEFELGRNGKNSNKQWAFDVVGKQSIIKEKERLPDVEVLSETLFPYQDQNMRYTAGIVAELPLFKGMNTIGRRIQAVSRYDQARKMVIEKAYHLEMAVRTAYEEYLLSNELLTIEKERAAVVRRRYRFYENLYNQGKISENSLETMRIQLFHYHDLYFDQQFSSLNAGENLRYLIRKFE